MSAETSPILSVRGLSKHFGGLKAVNALSFDVKVSSITSLIGPNGAGKTTVFNLITGVLPPTSGEVLYRGSSISGLSPNRIASSGIGRTFQEPRAFTRLSALDNVMVGFQQQRGERVLHALLRGGRTASQERENLARAMEILEFVGLSDKASELAQNLSHGQQRFLSLGRLLASNPDLLLLDEPTVGLHRDEIRRLIELIVGLIGDHKRTILLIEHNMDVVMNVSHEIHLLVEGTRVASGKPEDIKVDPRLIEAYLGVSLTDHAAAGAPGLITPNLAATAEGAALCN